MGELRAKLGRSDEAAEDVLEGLLSAQAVDVIFETRDVGFPIEDPAIERGDNMVRRKSPSPPEPRADPANKKFGRSR